MAKKNGIARSQLSGRSHKGQESSEKHLSRQVREFIDHIRSEASLVGVRIELTRGYQVRADGVLTTGYFCDETKVIKVATKRVVADWLGTLVHEYCHMLQWLQGSPTWREACLTIGSNGDAGAVFLDWICGEHEVSALAARTALRRVIANELDCDRRVVKIIRKWNLPITVESYVKQSNAYILFHHVAWTKRLGWYHQKRAPYDLRRVWKRMPTSLRSTGRLTSVQVMRRFPFLTTCL